MNIIIDKARQFTHTSLKYVDSDDIRNPVICINNDESIFFYCIVEGKAKIDWAANTKGSFIEGLKETIGLISTNEAISMIALEFIPEDYLSDMEEQGFTILCEWVDFWKHNLDVIYLEQIDLLNIRRIQEDEYQSASDITLSCRNHSRGYIGENTEWMREWNESENSCVFVAETNNEIIGVCCVSLYGFDSEKGIVLWLREIAVKPSYHSQKIGLNLMAYAIDWGKSKGAVRSFLACDTENVSAIKLYEKLGYVRDTERGQINMERIL